MTPPHIDIRKRRSFSDVLNVTFQFIKQVFGPLAKALLLIGGPVTLLVSIVAGTMQYQMLFGGMDPEAIAGNIGQFMLSYLAAMVGAIVMGGISTSMIIGAVQVYEDEGPEGVTVDRMWALVKANFWRMVGTVLFIGMLLFVVYIILIIPVFVVVGALAALVGDAGAIIGGIIAVFAVLGVLLVLFSLIVLLTLLLPIRMNEPIGVFQALGRCRALLKGQVWPSLGLLLVLWIIYTILGSLFSMPAIVVGFMAGLHTVTEAAGPVEGAGVFLTVLTVLGGLASMVLYTIPLVGAAFQYYNLVELKERSGLQARVAAMAAETEVTDSVGLDVSDPLADGDGDVVPTRDEMDEDETGSPTA
ncbi:MAG: hypothetical protein RhofKO_05840 [Rhodothermales bacterium]